MRSLDNKIIKNYDYKIEHINNNVDFSFHSLFVECIFLVFAVIICHVFIL